MHSFKRDRSQPPKATYVLRPVEGVDMRMVELPVLRQMASESYQESQFQAWSATFEGVLHQ